MTALYASFDRLFRKCKALFDGRVVSLAKNIDGSERRFLWNLLKCLESISDE